MKKKISFVLLGVGVMATPCFALFGEDLAALAQLIGQGVQMIRLTTQAADNVTKAAAYLHNGNVWKNALKGSIQSLDELSNGSDQVTLKRLNLAIAASRKAYEDLGKDEPTTANVAAMSALAMQITATKREADQLTASLQINDELRIARQHESWGCISCTMQRRKQ